MTTAVIFLVSLVLISYLIIRGFASKVFRSGLNCGLDSLAVAIPFGFASFSLLVSGFIVLGGNQILSAWLALATLSGLGSVAIGIVYKQRLPWGTFLFGQVIDEFETGIAGENKNRYNRWWYALTIILLGAFLSFLLVGTLQSNGDGSITLPKQASVDVAYHLSQVMNIAQTEQWNFEEPNFAGEFIRYPYLINMSSGILIKLGGSLEFAFHAPMVLLIFALIFGTLTLLRSFLLSWPMVLLVLGLTFFGSGLAYVYGYDFNAGPLAVTYPQQHINYTGFVAGFFAVQRAFLLGLALLVFAVLAFWRGLVEDNLTSLKWAGILLGLLPLAHTHSFFVGVIIFGSVLLYYIIRRDPMSFDIIRGTVFYSTFVAIIPLLAIVALPTYNLGGVPTWRWGWMTNPTEIGGLNLPSQGGNPFIPWLNFLVSNFGGMLLLFFISLIGLFGKLFKWNVSNIPGKTFWFTAMVGSVLWIVPNVIQFQTWDYDSNKFFVYAIFFSAVATALLVQNLVGWKKSLGTGLFLAILIFSLPIPILKLRHALTAEKLTTVTMFTQQQQEASRWPSQNTPETSVLITSAYISNSNALLNSVAMDSGRNTSVGYITWLYTHGIDYEPRLQLIEKFLQSGDVGLLNTKVETENGMQHVPADYLVLDELISQRFPNLENTLKQAKIEQVFHNSNHSIYKLQ